VYLFIIAIAFAISASNVELNIAAKILIIIAIGPLWLMAEFRSPGTPQPWGAGSGFGMVLLLAVVYLLVGFLAGWGIHSFVRKIKGD
jgi:hypothetical protein